MAKRPRKSNKRKKAKRSKKTRKPFTYRDLAQQTIKLIVSKAVLVAMVENSSQRFLPAYEGLELDEEDVLQIFEHFPDNEFLEHGVTLLQDGKEFLRIIPPRESPEDN